jgi:tetratricopeptide (TPR) repeat protein
MRIFRNRFPRKKLAACLVLFVLLSACGTDKLGYMKQGTDRLAKGDYRRAEIAFKKAIAKDNEFGKAYELLGQAQAKQGKYARAVVSMRRAAMLMPENIPVRVALAEILLPAYFAEGPNARRLLEEVRGLQQQIEMMEPGGYEALRLKAYVALAENKKAEGIDLLKQANGVKPHQAPVVTRLAELLISEKQGDEGEALLRETLKAKPDEAVIYDQLYMYYRSKGRTDDADALLHRKVEVFPRMTEYRIQLAAHYLDLRKPAESAKVLQDVIEHRADFPKADMHVGDYYARTGRWEEAVKQFEQGIQYDRKERSLYQKRIFEAQLAQGRLAAANEMLDAILKDDPKNAEARIAKATLRLDTLQDAELKTALKDFQALVAEFPDNAEYHFNLGRAYTVMEDFETAQNELTEAIKRNPALIQARIASAEVYIETQKFKQALQQADEVLSLVPDHPQARLLRIAGLLGQGNMLTARAELVRLQKERPDFTAAEIQLAYLETQEKRYAEAERILRKFYRPGSPDLLVLRGLASLYLAQGQGERAIEILNQEIKTAKESQMLTRMRMILAETATHAGKADIAVQQYEQALPKARRPAEIYYRISSLYASQSKADEAIHHLEQARKLAPQNSDIQLSLAAMLETKGQYRAAQPLYRKVLQSDPDNPVALNNLAFNLAESGGNLDEALQLIDGALKKMPSNPNLSDTLGWIYLKQRNIESALPIMLNLARRYPENSTFRYHLGVALIQKGDKARAKQELQAALSSRPPAIEENKIRQEIAKVE